MRDASDGLLSGAGFAAAMWRLGPFEPQPHLAVAVSGGADSMALALLAAQWVRARGGTLTGLIVDHGLRPEAGEEAGIAAQCLAAQAIPARILRLRGLVRGPGVAARARTARYQALTAACAEAGILHLLVAHHAADQAETVMHRALRSTASGGLAGMAAVVERETVRIVRPLLGIDPALLRSFLRDLGVGWVEDPSNRDPAALRTRLRASSSQASGMQALAQAASRAGATRAAEEVRTAEALACDVALYPEGFAVLPRRRLPVAAWRAVIQAVSGAAYPPGPGAVAAFAAAMAPGTLAGVRLLPAGRLGPGWLMVREEAAMSAAVPARPGVVWDGRFRLEGSPGVEGLALRALGEGAATVRRGSALPSAVLRTLPALWAEGKLVAVPHLLYPDRATCERMRLSFAPPCPVAGAPFLEWAEARAA